MRFLGPIFGRRDVRTDSTLGFSLRGALNLDALSAYMEAAVGVSIMIIGATGLCDASEFGVAVVVARRGRPRVIPERRLPRGPRLSSPRKVAER